MLSPDYIVGITDGEGSFNICLRQRPTKSKAWNHKVECHYYIKMVKSEYPLLEEIRKTIGCGQLYFQKEKRKNHQDCYRFEVTGLKQIRERIIPFFQRHKLQSPNKRKDFELFCQIVGMAERKEHLSESGWLKMQKLKEAMHNNTGKLHIRARPVLETCTPGGNEK
jgi:hypothetical protein